MSFQTFVSIWTRHSEHSCHIEPFSYHIGHFLLFWTVSQKTIFSTRVWQLNLHAMQSKMAPSGSFLPRSVAQVAQKEEVLAEIIKRGLLPTLSNSTHFYVDDEERDEHAEGLF